MTLTSVSLLTFCLWDFDSPPCSPRPLLLLVCEAASESCQLIPMACPLRVEGPSSWVVSLLITDDLIVSLTEALRRNVKSSDKLLVVILLSTPPPPRRKLTEFNALPKMQNGVKTLFVCRHRANLSHGWGSCAEETTQEATWDVCGGRDLSV